MNVQVADTPQQPVFVLGTGRCGTQSLAHLINACEGCVLEHEREPHLLAEAIEYIEGRMPHRQMVDLLHATRGLWTFPAGRVVGESNQRLSLVLPALTDAFPDARMIWMLRDGRDTVASLHQRLCYHRNEAALRHPDVRPWACHRPSAARLGLLPEAEWRQMDAFARCCWYWTYVNETIEMMAPSLESALLVVRLEELDVRVPDIARHLGLGRTDLSAAPRAGRNHSSRTVDWASWSRRRARTFERYSGQAMDRWYPGWRTAEWEAALQGSLRGDVHSFWQQATSSTARRALGARLRRARIHPAAWRDRANAR
jgi:hypothetical protein